MLWDTDVYFGTINCSKQCVYPCWDFWTIASTTTTTTHKLTERKEATKVIEVLKSLGNNWTDAEGTDFLKESVNVQIYFTSADVTVLATGETTEIMTLIGNIGGQLGE